MKTQIDPRTIWNPDLEPDSESTIPYLSESDYCDFLNEVVIHRRATFTRYSEFGYPRRLVAVYETLKPSTKSKIDRLHDHKGTLTVTWNSLPTRNEKIEIEKAWEDF